MNKIDPQNPFHVFPDAEENEAHRIIQNAADLEFLTRQTGWSILLENFEERKKNAIDVLLAVPPGSEKAILAAHAVAVAVVNTLEDLVAGVKEAIQRRETAKAFLDEKHNPEQFTFSDF